MGGRTWITGIMGCAVAAALVAGAARGEDAELFPGAKGEATTKRSSPTVPGGVTTRPVTNVQVPGVPATQPPAQVPPPAPVMKKEPLPTAGAITAANALVGEVFKEDIAGARSSAQKGALAAKFVKAGEEE